MKILLGPRAELHTGIHGSLIANPPSGVTYATAPCTHDFAFRPETTPFNPFDCLAVSETTSYKPVPSGVRAVHSSRIPFVGDLPWVADTDCFLSTLSCGQWFAVGSDRLRLNDVPRDLRELRKRAMLSLYCQDSCKGILFNTDCARRAAISEIEASDLLARRQFHELCEKMSVVYPTLPSHPLPDLNDGPVTVLFVGRTFEDKGGETAINVLSSLKRKYGARVRLVYVGQCPSEWRRDDGIVFLSSLPRSELLRIYAKAHIFFLPTNFESYGMVLIEAAAFGMAMVATCGTGMEHIDELFRQNENAHLISNDLPETQRATLCLRALESLIDNRQRLETMREANHRLMQTGKLSIAERDKKLLSHYERMLAAPHGPSVPLTSKFLTQHRLQRRGFSEAYLTIEATLRTQGKARRINIPVSSPS